MGLFWFIIVGIVGTAALTCVSFTKWRWWVRGLVALAATVIVAIMMAVPSPQQLGPTTRWFDESPFRELLLFALMLLGMAARVLSLAIERRAVATAETRAHVKVDRWEFVYPMLFAVPTFGALLSQVQSDTLTLANVVLAFQTGFFWQTILKREDARLGNGR
jgi:hypothetical protein